MYYFIFLLLIVFFIIEITAKSPKGRFLLCYQDILKHIIPNKYYEKYRQYIALSEKKINRLNNILYFISIVCLTLFLCLRYGQGSDYFGYMEHYRVGKSGIDEMYHVEYGFRVIIVIFNYFRLRYETFIFFISIVSMFFIQRAVYKFSSIKSLSLLLLYPTIYLTYLFSGIRQGLGISIFLGVMLNHLTKKEYIRYYLWNILTVMFHSSSAILLVLPLIIKFKYNTLKKLIPFSFIIFFVTAFTPLGSLLYIIVSKITYFGDEKPASLMGLFERIILVFIIIILYKASTPHNETINIFMKIYLFGFIFSVVFGSIPLVSQRMSAYLKSVEILLIPMFLYINTISKRFINITKKLAVSKSIVISVIVLYSVVFTFKNISSYIDQGEYRNKNIFEYSYVSVFNKEKIYDLRPVNREQVE